MNKKLPKLTAFESCMLVLEDCNKDLERIIAGLGECGLKLDRMLNSSAYAWLFAAIPLVIFAVFAVVMS